MHRHVRTVVTLIAVSIATAGCSSSAGQREQSRPNTMMLMAATPDGAVLLDREAESFIGVDRAGARVWTDSAGPARGAAVQCVDRCPNAVVSGTLDESQPDPAPTLFTKTSADPFPVPPALGRRVLTARSAADAVIAERDEQGRAWLRVLRAGDDLRIPLPGPDPRWSESADGSTALLLTRAGKAAAPAWWFVRTSQGWRRAGKDLTVADQRDACLAGGGRAAVLTGAAPALVLDRQRRIPLRTDLQGVGECALGDRGGALIQRSFSLDGRFRTSVRGIAPDGTQTWSKEYDTEAVVTVDPAGEHTAIAHDGSLDVLDRSGQVIRSESDVQGARFDASGELVVIGRDGAVRWLS